MSLELESCKRKPKDLNDKRNRAKRRCLNPKINKIRTKKVSRDPFQIPDPCVANILKYLSGKELLDVMEVCKHCKNTIEGRRAIMDRAMDEVVARFDDEKLIGNIGSCVPSKRVFKHIRSYYPSYFGPCNSFNLSSLVGNYASSLVSLDIECHSLRTEDNYMKSFQPATFPNLKSLALYCEEEPPEELGFPTHCTALHTNLVRFIRSCSFPEVTKLFLSLLSEYDCPDDEFFQNIAFNDIICNMPKLKALSCDMMSVFVVPEPNNLPQLEIFVTACDDISVYFHSLKELYISSFCYGDDIELILTNCTQLRVLQIDSFADEDEIESFGILHFPQHSNMEEFIVDEYDDNDF